MPDIQNHNLSAADEQRLDEAKAAARRTGDQVLSNPIPNQRYRLGTFSVACIIANRMIGTGIFDAPTSILRLDHNIEISLVLWFVGCCATLAGTLIYIEYGTTIPRFRFGGVAMPRFVPRNGGELIYMNYIFPHPPFLATCLFGIPFILIGNSAPNAISFGYHFLLAVGNSAPSGGAVTGVAILIALIVCSIHGTTRHYGIILNNVVASLKLIILMIIFILGCVVWGGTILHGKTADPSDHSCSVAANSTTWKDNLGHKNINEPVPTLNSISTTAGYGAAYLQIIFTFGGWNQANYVLGEIRQPHDYFRRTSLITIGLLCTLYMMVNVAFLVVVPVRDNPNDLSLVDNSDGSCGRWSVASEFFLLTCGSRRPYYAFLAFSSVGNIIVTTFTAARVKQEIAREGILPFYRFISRNYNVTAVISPLVRRLFQRKLFSQGLKPAPTPAAALFLHFVFTTILIFTTYRATSQDRYVVLLSIYSFAIDAFFAVCLAVGILWMRTTPILKRFLHWRVSKSDQRESWNDISPANPWVSITAASVMAVSNAFPLVASWMNGGLGEIGIPKYLTPAVGVGILGFGVLWWFGYYKILARGRRRVVKRKPEFKETSDDPEHPEMIFESIESYWEDPDANEATAYRRSGSGESGVEFERMSSNRH